MNEELLYIRKTMALLLTMLYEGTKITDGTVEDYNKATQYLEDVSNRLEKFVIPKIAEEKFNAIHLWNQAAEFSGNVHLTNGYWRALKDLKKLGIIKIEGIEPD